MARRDGEAQCFGDVLIMFLDVLVMQGSGVGGWGGLWDARSDAI